MAKPAVAVLTGGGPHDGRWELPMGYYFPAEVPDQNHLDGRYVLVRRFGEQYKGRPPEPQKEGGLYEWRTD